MRRGGNAPAGCVVRSNLHSTAPDSLAGTLPQFIHLAAP